MGPADRGVVSSLDTCGQVLVGLRDLVVQALEEPLTQILVVASEDTEPTAVGITHSDIAPERAQAMCDAASRHFAELAIEAEIQRRIAARTEGEG